MQQSSDKLRDENEGHAEMERSRVLEILGKDNVQDSGRPDPDRGHLGYDDLVRMRRLGSSVALQYTAALGQKRIRACSGLAVQQSTGC